LCSQAAKQRLGSIDYLVLNHIADVSMGRWQSTAENITYLENVMNVNFLAYVRLASSAMELLRRSSGSIVVVSSVAGINIQVSVLPYLRDGNLLMASLHLRSVRTLFLDVLNCDFVKFLLHCAEHLLCIL